jgi:hypothetical protein
MKRIAFVVLFVATLLLGNAGQSVAAQVDHSPKGTGLIRMKHSPTVGINVTFAVYIDGPKAGVFSRGHVFERALSAGRHTVRVVRTGRSDSWTGTLDIRAGETKSFVVKVSPDAVHLDPVSRID